MGTAICSQTMQSLFETLVKPAILTVLNDGQGLYRCERDLHHHLTVCLDRIQPLHLGSRERVLQTEKPAIARYGSGRHGNIDFFVGDESHCAGSQTGVAVEVNWNYNDPFKAHRDLCKLIDPKNAYAEPVYFAYGTCQDLLKAVQQGLERAFTTFVDCTRFRARRAALDLLFCPSYFGINAEPVRASPSSPTEGLKISNLPGKRHQTRHLDFAFFGC